MNIYEYFPTNLNLKVQGITPPLAQTITTDNSTSNAACSLSFYFPEDFPELHYITFLS